jgi:K+-sensing histidine kinase KdpD
MDVNLFKDISRYPFIYQDDLYDSQELRQNKTCKEKCIEKDCFKLFDREENLTEYVCSKGYNNLLLIAKDLKFILNGLIFSDNREVPEGRKKVRQDWICNKDAVLIFAKKIEEIEKHLIQNENETTLKNFSIFHDFKTSMKILYHCTEDIIDNLPGDSFEDKLKSSGKSYQDLYHSLSLLTSQLRMIDIFINPNGIIFGTKKLINIYKLFDKIVKLFERLAERKRDVSIKIFNQGYVYDSYCYDSIEFIPLILIDNALKYSVADSEIEVRFQSHRDSVTVIVKNIGPVVPEANREKIFEKFYRDESAQSFSKEGLGMGLWIAQQILTAHGSKLYYHTDPTDMGRIGLNVFTFDLMTVRT